MGNIRSHASVISSVKILLKIVIGPMSVAVLFAVSPANLSAQWPNYPLAGVPRTPDGKPILDAPAPKAADGHPDLSGIWAARGGGGGGRGGAQ